MKTFLQFTEAVGHSTLENAKQIILGLRKHGFQAYLAGGCVRDMLLGTQPKDFDVATSATPDEVTSIFPGGELVGQKFGVVIVNGIDVATFRKDGIYSDGRRPDSVTFSKSAEEDAARRDFTFNALFLDPFTGQILDFHNGRLDLSNKVLRAVGNPIDRFTQDHLRILRADRFASRYGFTIHPDTEAAMTATSHHLADIDAERITQELTKSLAHDAFRTVSSMKKTGSLAAVLPEVNNEASSDFKTTMGVLSQVKPGSTTEFAFCALLFKLRAPAITALSRRMKFTNELRDHILGVQSLQARIMEATEIKTMDVLKKVMRDKYFPDALKLFTMRVQEGDLAEYTSACHYITTLYASMTHHDLNPPRFVTGDDLIDLGMKPSKEFKDILDAVERGQLNGTITSKDQAMELVRSGKILSH